MAKEQPSLGSRRDWKLTNTQHRHGVGAHGTEHTGIQLVREARRLL